MKIVRTLAVCLAVLGFVSCNSKLETSEYRSFTLKDKSGQSVEAGIYLPVGYSDGMELPVVYFCDELAVRNQENYCHLVDSMVENSIITPVAMVIIPNLNTVTADCFADDLMPYVQKHFGVSSDRDGAVFFGSLKSAKAGLVMSFERPELISEYWLSSPGIARIDDYGLLGEEIQYHITWGAKDESSNFEEYSSLLNSIRKRGGQVQNHAFEGLANNTNLKAIFCQSMEEHFGLLN